MGDIFEPKFHKAWNEALLKEKRIRLKWFQDQLAKPAKDASGDETDENTDLPCTCKDRGRQLKLFQKLDWPRKGAVGTATIIRVADTRPAMRQPSSVLKSKLYEGTGHDGHGRIDYLQRRLKEDPAEKFRSRVCTSWDYGWYFGTGENELTCKRHPDNCDIKKRAFFRL